MKTLILERRHLVGGGHHRGAASRLLVHDLQLRALAAAAADHPGAGADQARLSAAADVDRFAPATTASTCASTATTTRRCARSPASRDADAYEQYSHDLDRVCQAIKPLLDTVPPDRSATTGGAAGPGGPGLAAAQPGQADAAQRGAAADRERRRLPRRLLRVAPAQGVPGLVLDHRLQGRAALAGERPGPALPLPGRARRRIRELGLPQGRQRRLHAGAGARGKAFGAEIRLEAPSSGC